MSSGDACLKGASGPGDRHDHGDVGREGDPIDRYLAALADKVAGQRDADDLVAEMADHLRESAARRTQDGRTLAEAQRIAIRRFGDPDLVSEALLAGRGRRRLSDPVTVRRWPFLVAELLLITAGLVLAVSTYVYWQPCGAPVTITGGPSVTSPHVTQGVLPSLGVPSECMRHGDTIATVSASAALISGILEAVTYTVLGLAWLIFVMTQPWLLATRVLAAVPAVLTLFHAPATALVAGQSSGQVIGWMIGLDLLPVVSIELLLATYLSILLSVLLISDDQLSQRRPTRPWRSGRTGATTMPWGAYLTRTYLLFLAALGAEPISHWMVSGSTMSLFGIDDEMLNAGASYLVALGIAGPAVLSVVVGSEWRRRSPALARSWTAPGRSVIA